MRKSSLKSRLFEAILACSLLLLAVGWAAAATLTVTEGTDLALRTAILHAAPGDTVFLSVTNPVVLTNGELVINKNLKLTGDDPNLAVISGGHSNRVLNIVSGNVCLTRLSIIEGARATSGPPAGAGIFNRGQLTLSNCFIFGNLNEAESTIENPNTNLFGGGICNSNVLIAYDCIFASNRCSGFGGAIYNAGALSLSRVLLTNNTGFLQGGGVNNAGSGTATLLNCLLEGNRAATYGGAGLANETQSHATVTSCSFSNNVAEYFGGGGILNWGYLWLTNCTLAANQARRDSGVSTLAGAGGGGGVFNCGGFAALDHCVIGPTNTARRGAGVLNYSMHSNSPATLLMNASTIHGNKASISGGGLMNFANGAAANSRLTNGTISYNLVGEADGAGHSYTAAGIDNSTYAGPATMNVVNCTIAWNSIAIILGPPVAGGIFSFNFSTNASDSAIVNVGNSILNQNSALNGFTVQAGSYNSWGASGGASIASLGHNICSDLFSPFHSAGDVIDADARLTALIQRGSVLVHGLLMDSPAIDAADPAMSPGIDARGYPRPFGLGYDCGAVEQTPRIDAIAFYGEPPYGPYVQLLFTTYRYGLENHQIEYSESLRPDDWHVTEGQMTPVFNDQVVFTQAEPVTAPYRFYRIKIIPPTP